MTPSLRIDLNKIEHNARVIVGLCQEHGIAVSGVTKCVCGHPEIAKAMLRGGVKSIADSRLENIRRMQAADVETSFELIRLPPLSAAAEVVETTKLSLNSEVAVLTALSDAAVEAGKIHDVVLMVDLGDLREGMWPDELLPVARDALRLPGIRIAGIGANLGCFAGIEPSAENLQLLADLADEVERECGIKLDRISGHNSSGLELIASGKAPTKINHARIGEAILLGRETTHRRPLPDTFQDAFELKAEVLELKQKPSQPIGKCAEDAFGHRPEFADCGEILRALLNVGREDIQLSGIVPRDSRLSILGASSGYLALDASAAQDKIRVGEEVSFDVNYGALLRAMTSEFVKKQLEHDSA